MRQFCPPFVTTAFFLSTILKVATYLTHSIATLATPSKREFISVGEMMQYQKGKPDGLDEFFKHFVLIKDLEDVNTKKYQAMTEMKSDFDEL